MVRHLDALFPSLGGAAYQVTSPKDNVYNCVAWAAGDTHHWWWPDRSGGWFWPPGFSRAETLPAFQEVFTSLGYRLCTHEELETGFEKIALFADEQSFPRHVARQLSNGHWTSKLGELEDIEHNLHDLEGLAYGLVAQIMKRPFSTAEPAPSA